MKFIPVPNPDETKWKIGMDNIDWANEKNKCGCSFNVLGARLLNLSYPDYLRYLRANGAELYGRTGYSYAYFEDKGKCQSICTLLNKEWDRVKSYVEG